MIRPCSFTDKSIAKDSLPTLNDQIQKKQNSFKIYLLSITSILFRFISANSKEAELLQNIFTIHYIYTFQVYLCKKHPKDYLPSSKEIMFLYGIGFKGIDQ